MDRQVLAVRGSPVPDCRTRFDFCTNVSVSDFEAPAARAGLKALAGRNC